MLSGASVLSGADVGGIVNPMNQVAPNPFGYQLNNKLVSVAPGGNKISVISRPPINGASNPSVKIQPNVRGTFQQLNDIGADLCAALTAAGSKKIIELGFVKYFLDVSATALVVSKILCIPPGGGPPFDFASIQRLKTSGDGWPLDGWDAGKWTFIGLADCSALALKINAVQYDDF